MNRRKLLSLSLGLASSTSAIAAEPPSLHSRLLGLWSLNSAVTVTGDDTVPWLGRKNPITGAIVFLESGWMSVQIGGSRPANVSRSDFSKLTSDERLAVFDQYYAYYGTFEVDEATSSVKYHVIDSLLPFERGDVLKRHFILKDDLLTVLTEPREEAGKSHFNRLIWKKID